MKKMLSLCLALLLCAMLALPAAADAWIPPTDDGGYNEALVYLPYAEGDCKPLNVFLSNYAEANLAEFDPFAADALASEVTLKHFELNPTAYPEDVLCETDANGAAYMRITGEKYEERVSALFGRALKAEDCPGYQDGAIYVTAENYGAPVQVFAHAVFCNYMGDGHYYVAFDVYKVMDGVADCYALADIPEDGTAQQLGRGYANFSYAGDMGATEFHAYNFTLVDFWMNAENIPYTNENLPYTPEEPTTEPPVQTPDAPAMEKGALEMQDVSALGEPADRMRTVCLVIVGVAVLAVAVVTVILVKWRKKS